MIKKATGNAWLMKSEPETYSIRDLERDKKTYWEGVRNYQARNFLRDDAKTGDWVLFYHSNAEPTGVAGLARVCREAYPDHAQFDPKSDYFDPKAKKDAPRWFMVDIEFVERFSEILPLAELKTNRALQGMALLQPGQRLSVQPVSLKHLNVVLKMAGAKTRLRV